MKKNVIVLTGAGISAESGLATFRDNNGLWENYKVEDVATYTAWQNNKALVLEFYNQRRRNVLESKPNAAHKALAELQQDYHVAIITQNIDDLHERAESKNILHLHGQILQVRPDEALSNRIKAWTTDLHIGDTDERGVQYRPHIVWFGEDVPNIQPASTLMQNADAIVIIGTSLQVYPAAGLLQYAPPYAPLIVIDKEIPAIKWRGKFIPIKDSATIGVAKLKQELKKLFDEK